MNILQTIKDAIAEKPVPYPKVILNNRIIFFRYQSSDFVHALAKYLEEHPGVVVESVFPSMCNGGWGAVLEGYTVVIRK
jgi:hypothetical protein